MSRPLQEHVATGRQSRRRLIWLKWLVLSAYLLLSGALLWGGMVIPVVGSALAWLALVVAFAMGARPRPWIVALLGLHTYVAIRYLQTAERSEVLFNSDLLAFVVWIVLVLIPAGIIWGVPKSVRGS